MIIISMCVNNLFEHDGCLDDGLADVKGCECEWLWAVALSSFSCLIVVAAVGRPAAGAGRRPQLESIKVYVRMDMAIPS